MAQTSRHLNTKKSYSTSARNVNEEPITSHLQQSKDWQDWAAGGSGASDQNEQTAGVSEKKAAPVLHAKKTGSAVTRKRTKKKLSVKNLLSVLLPRDWHFSWWELLVSIVKLILIELLFLALIRVGYDQFIQPAISKSPVWVYSSPSVDEAVCTLAPNDVLVQRFYQEGPLCSVAVTATYNPPSPGEPLYVIARLYDGTTGALLASDAYGGYAAPDYGCHIFSFSGEKASNGVYELRLSLLNFAEDNPVTVYTSHATDAITEPAVVNGTALSASVVLNVGMEDESFAELYWMFGRQLLIIVALTYLIYRCFFLHAALRYACCAILVGSLVAFVFPPFDSYDEHIHFGTAYAYASQYFAEQNGEDFDETLASYRTDRRLPEPLSLYYYALPARTGDEVIAETKTVYGKETLRYYYQNLEIGYDVENNNDGTLTMPIYPEENRFSYLPSTMGIIVGRNMGASAQLLPVFARMGSYLVYVLLCTLGIFAIPRGKAILSVCALIPSALYITLSAANDLYHCGVAIFCIGILLRLVEAKKVTPILVVVSALSFAFSACVVIAAHQYQLLPLILLAIVLLGHKVLTPKVKPGWQLAILLVCGCAAIALWYWAVRTGKVVYIPSANSSIGLNFVICHPFEALEMIFHTILANLQSLWDQWLVGAGDFNMGNFPASLVAVMLAVTGYTESRKGGYSTFSRIMFGLCGIGICLLSFCVGFNWTDMETYTADQSLWGVQGRYFLSAIPLFLLSLRPAAPKVEKGHVHTYAMGMCFVNCFIALNVLWLVYAR